MNNGRRQLIAHWAEKMRFHWWWRFRDFDNLEESPELLDDQFSGLVDQSDHHFCTARPTTVSRPFGAIDWYAVYAERSQAQREMQKIEGHAERVLYRAEQLRAQEQHVIEEARRKKEEEVRAYTERFERARKAGLEAISDLSIEWRVHVRSLRSLARVPSVSRKYIDGRLFLHRERLERWVSDQELSRLKQWVKSEDASRLKKLFPTTKKENPQFCGCYWNDELVECQFHSLLRRLTEEKYASRK